MSQSVTGQLEAHAEQAPVFGFQFAPGKRSVLVLVAGEAVEGGAYIVDAAQTVEASGFALNGLETAKGGILKTLQFFHHRAFGALPSHSGQLVGTAVFPNDGVGVILFLAADAERLGQLGVAAEDGNAG